jgi:FkbH-like protein
MYNTLFSNISNKKESVSFSSPLLNCNRFVLLNWEEHCVECSPPYCYHNCELYKKRDDGCCVRIQNGICKTSDFPGLLGYSVRCEFRKWAKIESRYSGTVLSIKKNRFVDKASRFLSYLSYHCTIIPTKVSDWVYNHYFWYRNQYFRNGRYRHRSYSGTAQILYVNCFLVDKLSAPLLIQVDNDERIVYTKIHQLKAGENVIVVNLEGQIKQNDRVFITPLEETNTIIYFRYLDFVNQSDIPIQTAEKPASKVKVVAWDLDNTLWEGILENTNDVQLRKEAIETIIALDARGILNTIVSKNDYDKAMFKLKEFAIDEYFLCPAINWGQKSENLKHIAEALNLGIDSFAFVDDNIREREEVKDAIPTVRVYAETEINELLAKDEFNVPITEECAKRRFSYMAEVSRLQFKEKFSDDYDSFLKNLSMNLKIEEIDESNRSRCFELLSRSNQLNLSTNRYTLEEYEKLLNDSSCICRAFRCSDKFGDYGIVAFVSISIDNKEATIRDLVISCRVAKKKVEETIIYSLRDDLMSYNVTKLKANLIKTKKNGPLSSVFTGLPFSIVEETERTIRYEIEDIATVQDPGIMRIELGCKK